MKLGLLTEHHGDEKFWLVDGQYKKLPMTAEEFSAIKEYMIERGSVRTYPRGLKMSRQKWTSKGSAMWSDVEIDDSLAERISCRLANHHQYSAFSDGVEPLFADWRSPFLPPLPPSRFVLEWISQGMTTQGHINSEDVDIEVAHRLATAIRAADDSYKEDLTMYFSLSVSWLTPGCRERLLAL